MFRNKKGESGIGTLILFIAMILVAAIAAGVLIQTSMNLQSKALSTGSKAKTQVSTSASITSVWAEDGTNGTVKNFYANVKLVPGSDPMKLSDTLVELILDNTSREYTAGSEDSAQATGTNYNYDYEITGTGNKSGYIVPGDLLTINFEAPRDVTEDEDYRISVSPKTGSITQVYGSTPEIMTTKKVFLFP